MTKKSANTPKPAKPPRKAAKNAARAAQGGQRITREATNSRKEIRQQSSQRQGHPK
jgi:hypothetical protein